MALALGLLGCATPQSEALRQTNAPFIELSAAPFFPQVAYYCGPAALATVLGFHGQNVAPDLLVPRLVVPGREGSLQTEMLAQARQQGMLAVRLPQNLEAIVHELVAGNPVLVLQNLGLSWAPSWHYAVVVGHDPEQEFFILRSGNELRQLMSYALFERTWARGAHWAAVIRPPDRLPVSVTREAVREALVALERQVPAAAAMGYAQARERWPDEAVFWIGGANAWLAAGDVDAAAQVLDERLARVPDDVVALNNRASLYLQKNDGSAADALLQRAERLLEQTGGAWAAAVQATRAEWRAMQGAQPPPNPPASAR